MRGALLTLLLCVARISPGASAALRGARRHARGAVLRSAPLPAAALGLPPPAAASQRSAASALSDDTGAGPAALFKALGSAEGGSDGASPLAFLAAAKRIDDDAASAGPAALFKALGSAEGGSDGTSPFAFLAAAKRIDDAEGDGGSKLAFAQSLQVAAANVLKATPKELARAARLTARLGGDMWRKERESGGSPVFHWHTLHNWLIQPIWHTVHNWNITWNHYHADVKKKNSGASR